MLGDPSHVVARYGSMRARDAAAGLPAARQGGGSWMLWAGLLAAAVAAAVGMRALKRRR